jgi:alcohol dehydrogenase (cytochrome c)
LLSTGGHLLFGHDTARDFMALDVDNGKPLWHAQLPANPTNGPQTFLLDGKQYILVAGGDTLYAFTLPK